MSQVKSNTELEREEVAALEAKKQANRPVLTLLAGYIQSAFSAAQQHRDTTGVTQRLINSKRLKAGEYDDTKLAQIEQTGGSNMFFNITESKCESFEAWMADVFSGSGERPWDLTPTPIPELDGDEARNVEQLTVQRFQQMQAAGQPITPEEVQQFACDLYDEVLRVKTEDAQERASRMAQKIEDQTVEGGFEDALSDFFTDLGDYPSAILKGPVFTKTKRLNWRNGAVAVEEEVVPHWTTVNPVNFFPGPNARSVHEAYLCEVIDYDRGDLANMRGQEGWNTQAIEQALGLHAAGVSNSLDNLPGESAMAALEDRNMSINSGRPEASIRALEFWGNVQGSMLKQWGMPGIDDDFRFYAVTCTMINNIVVRAVMNPDPLGKRPYYVTSFIKNKNSLWGLKSIPEKMEDCQEGVNGCQRNLMDNLAFCSGPQVAADLDATPAAYVPTLNQQYPRKVWAYHGTKTHVNKPVDFFQPQSNASELIDVSDYYEKKSDDRTLIPRYVVGDQDLSGAGATASGLSMLMGASSRGIKRVIKNVDKDILRPVIYCMYVYNMLHLDDDSLKGDAQVVPRGALAMLVREQTQLRRQEFLSMTNNPTDLQIIGIERRANLLREIAKGLDLPEDKVVPSEDELRARMGAPTQPGDEPAPQEEE